MNRSWLAMVPAVATLLCAPPAAAQTFALDENRPNVLWAEIQRPAFKGDQYLSAWLGFVGVRYQFASQLSVLAGLPFAQAELAAHDVGGTRVPGATSTALGNPYVGLRLGLPWQTVAVDAVISLRLKKPSGPTYDIYGVPHYTSNPVVLAGVSGDYDRLESFQRAPWSARVAALVSRKLSGSVSLHLRAGVVLLLGDFPYGYGYDYGYSYGYGSRAFADLGAAATYESGTTVASAGLTFRTGDGTGQGSRPVQLALSVGRRIGQATPMVFVRVPLGGSSQTLARYVLGVGLTLRLGEPSSGL